MTYTTKPQIEITSRKATACPSVLLEGLSLVSPADHSKTPSLTKSPRSDSSKSSDESTEQHDIYSDTSHSDGEDHIEIDGNERILKERFPTSTSMERKRFLTGRPLEKASRKMSSYMQWRKLYKLDDASYLQRKAEIKSDGDAWDFAVEQTFKCYEDRPKSTPCKLPRVIKFGEVDDIHALDGRRVGYVLPGRIDRKLASLDFYARCLGVFLDLKLDRESSETIYIVVDVRSGLNWPNLSPTKLLSFVKSLNKQLINAMPERMHQTIVFPIPLIAKPVWGLFKNILDKKITAKISVLWGKADTSSPVPKGLPTDVFDDRVIESLESIRRSEFIYL